MQRILNRSLSQTVLCLQVRPPFADILAEQIRTLWMVEPVQFARPGKTTTWLEVYFPTAIEATLASFALGSNKNILARSIRRYTPRNWLSFCTRQFKARDIGMRLRICPPWNQRRKRERVNVIIRPGLSFGTGDHFTTQFCLEMIDSLSRPHPPVSFLDVGTGSGILAIAAARLGARQVVATDNDKQALCQAHANAKLNRLTKNIRWVNSDIMVDALPKGRFDIVAANLYASLLNHAAPSLVRAAKQFIILSGILEQETDKVSDVFLDLGAYEIVRDGNGEWSGLVFETTSGRKTKE